MKAHPNQIQRGELNPSAKLNWDTVRRIRLSNSTAKVLAKRHRISMSQVYRIKANEHWYDPRYCPRSQTYKKPVGIWETIKVTFTNLIQGFRHESK